MNDEMLTGNKLMLMSGAFLIVANVHDVKSERSLLHVSHSRKDWFEFVSIKFAYTGDKNLASILADMMDGGVPH